MAIRAVIFDAADTLIHPNGTIGEIYWSVARHYGCTAGPEAIQASFQRNFPNGGPLSRASERDWWRAVVERVFSDVGRPDDFDGFFDAVYERFESGSSWVLFPEAFQTLEQLQSLGLRLGVLSNFDSRLFAILDHLAVRTFFSAVTISSDSGYAKPDRRIFLEATRALEVEPWEALMVGDSVEADILPAERCGLEALLIDRHHRHIDAPVRRVQSLLDVPRFLK